MHRRKFLAISATGPTVALAGCFDEGPDIQVRTRFRGPYTLTVRYNGSSTTYNGEGASSYDIGSPDSVSASMQKDTPSRRRARVQIVEDGEVVDEGDALSPWGTARASHEVSE